ncbi:hypothetical protein LTR36_005067 [Oleoguttula mirabilis]|uniref:VTC domain-containing protein n=1 Tax=Oleoguttula mirabilis TaxID=1507867 RepID=A0AAV9JVY3_9PEZI|nr:hypothetical protein LTR36_005067 [Oleoguttula mirabilis]
MARKRTRNLMSNEGDRYWRLGRFDRLTKAQLRPHLQAAGYPLKSNTDKPTMLHYGERIERNLLCYYPRTDAELRTFARDRRLSIDGGRGAYRKRAMVEGLMAADDEQRFRRFLDLPPELRNEVYRWHMAAFPDGLLTPAQPPLTGTSRLVRRESLPLFHEDCRFDVRAAYFSGMESDDEAEPISKSHGFVEALTKREDARIGKLRFSLKEAWDRAYNCSVEVTLRKADAATRSVSLG